MVRPVILSDRSIREELAAGRIVIDPFDDALVQPSSVDVRLDRLFRVFRNHTAGVIDVKLDLTGLTELIEIADDGVFMLHPGEFVLGSTLERVALPDDLVARIEGKALVDLDRHPHARWVVDDGRVARRRPGVQPLGRAGARQGRVGGDARAPVLRGRLLRWIDDRRRRRAPVVDDQRGRATTASRAVAADDGRDRLDPAARSATPTTTSTSPAPCSARALRAACGSLRARSPDR